MKPYKTSMLLDYQAKRPLEVEAILGNAIRIAARADIHVPHLQTLYALLKLSDEKNRSAGLSAEGCLQNTCSEVNWDAPVVVLLARSTPQRSTLIK
jgi:hypothetical protein